MKHVLITGGAGFIGSRLAKKLAGNGYQVTVLDSLSPQVHSDQTFSMFSGIGNIRTIQGDVRDPRALEMALEGVDGVVHLAAETGTGQSMYELVKYSEVNIQASALLLELVGPRKEAIEKLVVASSRAIYGEGAYRCDEHGIVYPPSRKETDLRVGKFEPVCPICSAELTLIASDENSRISPTSIYGVTKQVQEQMFMLVGGAMKIPACSLRYQNVYGPGQSLTNPYTGILSIFSTLIRNKGEINVFEDGLESRDFVYIDDVVDATYTALLSSASDNQVFNIGTGIATSVIDVVHKLFEGYGQRVPFKITGNYRVGDIRHNKADITKAQRLLEFSPKVDFASGISMFCEWVSGQEVSGSRYGESILEMKNRGLFK